MLDAWIDKSGGASPSLVARPPSLVVRPPSLVAHASAWNRISGLVFGVLDWGRGIGLKSASWIRFSGCFDCFFCGFDWDSVSCTDIQGLLLDAWINTSRSWANISGHGTDISESWTDMLGSWTEI